MTKKLLAILVALIMVVGLAGQAAYAGGHYKDKSSYGSKDDDKLDLGEKFCKKVKMVMKYRKELDLTKDQEEKIKKLKFDTKKAQIKRCAEIDVKKVEIHAEMWMDKMNTAKINELIEEKYDLKKEKAKAYVAAIAQLKSILTEKQQDELTTLYLKDKD